MCLNYFPKFSNIMVRSAHFSGTFVNHVFKRAEGKDWGRWGRHTKIKELFCLWPDHKEGGRLSNFYLRKSESVFFKNPQLCSSWKSAYHCAAGPVGDGHSMLIAQKTHSSGSLDGYLVHKVVYAKYAFRNDFFG